MSAKLKQVNYVEKYLTNFKDQFPDFDVIFMAQTGSKLYGTNRPTSDDDIRAICLPSREYVLSLTKGFDCYEDPSADTKVHSLKMALKMLANGDPQMTEMMFVPEQFRYNTGTSYEVFGDQLVENTDKFISMNIYNRLCGFAYSEFRKARAEKIEFEKLPQEHETLRSNLVNYMRERGADKNATDEMLELFDSHRGKKIVPSVSNLGAKRKADVEAYGYCTSSMSHSIRLLGQLKELMLDGTITFPRYNADFLRNIRTGKVKLEEACEAYEQALSEAEAAKLKTVLRPKPDAEWLDSFYRDTTALFIE